MTNLILFISNNLPTEQRLLNFSIHSFYAVMISLQMILTIVFCYVIKDGCDKIYICLYNVVISALLISASFIIHKAIKYLSDSQNVLNTLSNKKQINYDKCLFDMSKLNLYSAFLCIFIITIILSFNYTIIIPILSTFTIITIICAIISINIEP